MWVSHIHTRCEEKHTEKLFILETYFFISFERFLESSCIYDLSHKNANHSELWCQGYGFGDRWTGNLVDLFSLGITAGKEIYFVCVKLQFISLGRSDAMLGWYFMSTHKHSEVIQVDVHACNFSSIANDEPYRPHSTVELSHANRPHRNIWEMSG